MVRVGEASGKLEAVLRAIVEDRTRRELMADRINSAIRYPLFLIGTAAVIRLFFLIYVVPQFEPVFKDLGGRLNSGAAAIVAESILHIAQRRIAERRDTGGRTLRGRAVARGGVVA